MKQMYGVRNGVLVLAFLLALIPLHAAQDAVGKIVYLEGQVDIHRNGELLDWEGVDIGFSIEAFDLIETATDGYSEIQLTLPQSGGAVIKVQKNTAFYFEVQTVSGKPQTNFRMLAGSIAMRVKNMTAGQEVTVSTQSAVMGVRGTDFMVSSGADGSVLITCVEGAVSCVDSQGRELYAKPGAVVEQNAGEASRAVSVKPEDVDAYRGSWLALREEVFKAGAAVFIQTYALRYLDNLPQFQAAYNELAKNYTLLRNAISRGSSTPQGTLMQVKREVSQSIFKMRGIFPMFEHTFYYLDLLEGYHRQGFGKGLLKKRYTTDDFFAEYLKGRKEMKKQMDVVRHMFKLYVLLDHLISGDSMMDDVFGGSPITPIGPPTGGMGGF